MSSLRCWCQMLVLLLVACSTTDPDPPEPFALEIVVRRDDGSGVAGLGVVVAAGLLGAIPLDEPLARRAATRVRFTLAEPLLCSMRVHDAAGEVIAVLIDHEPRAAGTHEVVFAEDTQGSGHLSVAPRRFELVLEDPTTGEQVHRSSRWGLRYLGSDLERCTIGFTDEDGRLVLDDPRIAPGAFDLPVFERVDEQGDVVGSFSVSDTVTVTVHDPLEGRSLAQTLVLGSGRHRLEILWDAVPGVPTADLGTPAARMRDVPPPDTSTRLFPISPNPYN